MLVDSSTVVLNTPSEMPETLSITTATSLGYTPRPQYRSIVLERNLCPQSKILRCPSRKVVQSRGDDGNVVDEDSMGPDPGRGGRGRVVDYVVLMVVNVYPVSVVDRVKSCPIE